MNLLRLKKLWLIIILLIVGSAFFILHGFNVKDRPDGFYVPTGSSIEDVFQILRNEDIIKNKYTFALCAKILNYSKVEPGKYRLKDVKSNLYLVLALKFGKQEPVKLTFNNQRTLGQFAQRLSQILEADSASFVQYFLSEECFTKLDADSFSVISKFIPNTYEFYWNTSPSDFVDKMLIEYKRFWNNEKRKSALKELNLTENQVITVASIVEKETTKSDEKSRIAGVYLNRFWSGQRLEADPTVVFAVGDFSINRILLSHLETDSPYNTYMYSGLPPGPICMPDINSIDATLNAERHQYMFFCARPDYSGYHNFAKDFEEHKKYANIYRNWLDKEGIK